MALINKTGITNGGTIQAEHVTRAIDALSGGSTDSVIATGSFTGSFKGDGSQLTGVTGEWDGTLNGNASITGSLIATSGVTASLQGTASWAQNAITANTASYVLNAVSASYANNSTTADTAATSSYVLNAVSSSFATSASIATSAATATTAATASFLNTLNQPTVTVNGTTSFNNVVNMGGLAHSTESVVYTTDATQTNIWSYRRGSSDAKWYITFDVTVHASNGEIGSPANLDGVAGGTINGAALYDGTVTQVSSSFSNFASPVQFGITATANTASIFVKGLAGTNITWYATVNSAVKTFANNA